jgi:predicted MFS family arabinose efflux permease
VDQLIPSVGCMTTTTIVADTPLAAQQLPPLVTRPLLLRFVSIIGASSSFYLPLSVVPLYAKSVGANAGAGFATGVLLLATVSVELVTPRLVAWTGYRLALSLGLVCLGLPALGLLTPPDLAVIVAVSAVRGAGFAVVTVAGGTLTASLIPRQRRGEGLALTGVISGVPALACLPLGVWVSVHWGFAPVFVATAATALLALAPIPALPGRPVPRRKHSAGPRAVTNPVRHGTVRALANASLTRPAALFSASTMAAGVLVTFLPLAVAQRSAAVVSIALFAQPAAATLARLAAGRFGDRHGHAQLLYPGIGLAAAGMAAIAATGTPGLVIGGAAAFGVGFGLLQNATLSLMYTRTARDGYGTVNALWNAAYDAGMGVGAIGMGLVTGHLGYPATFLLTAALVLAAVIPARRERDAGTPAAAVS